MNQYRLLDRVKATLTELDPADPTQRASVEALAHAVIRNLGDDLGVTGGRLYERDGLVWELVSRFGEGSAAQLGLSIAADYGPFLRLLEQGVIVMDTDDPMANRDLEERIGAERFAAIVVADERFVISFDVSPRAPRDEILQALSIIRYGLNQKVRADRYLSIIQQSRSIQQSILPREAPHFEGFDIWGRTQAAEYVSGDYYDFLPLSEKALGLAVADATGHGLPAALVVRDIHMGLRMGSDRDLKIVRTVEKLNRIISDSQVSTKFVSLFFAELESTGAVIYVNAGHLPPIHWSVSGTRYLEPTGVVLGPNAEATYNRGFTSLEPGEILCLFTDGIVEAPDSRDEEFGTPRLESVIGELAEEPADVIGRTILERVEDWTGGTSPDDRTVVIVKRLA